MNWSQRFLVRLSSTAIGLLLILSLACRTPIPCDEQLILLAPTPTQPFDPDLSQLPNLFGGSSGGTYCPTPYPTTIASAFAPTQFVAADVVNLSLDVRDQELSAAVIGDDMLAVSWLTDGNVFVALSKGGSHFQVRRVDTGVSVALAFSNVNRLHVVYEKGGEVWYRAADQGVHPADVSAEFVTVGTDPTIVLDQYNYAHIVFESAGSLHHASQVMTDQWNIAPIAGVVVGGSNVSFAAFGEDINLGYFVTYTVGKTVHIAKWQTTPYGFFPTWQPVTAFPIAANEDLLGGAQIAFAQTGADRFVVASWVAIRPNLNSPTPDFAQPIFEPVNPLYPHSIANPDQIANGLNAVRWRNDPHQPKPFAAGLYQFVSVTDTRLPISISSFGRGEGSSSLPLLRIGIDPTGQTNPNAPTVQWSAVSSPSNFTSLSASVMPSGGTATVFLDAQQPDEEHAVAIWDNVGITNATLQNPDFENTFVAQDSSLVPDGWSMYYEDSGNAPIAGRDLYSLYSAWSSDGGISWSSPTAVVQNRDGSGTVTGGLEEDAYPFISTNTATPTVSFFYIYAAGDPPADSDFIRFGRPHTTLCDWGMTNCTEMPGQSLLARNAISPSETVLLASDPFNPDRAILVWDSRQTDIIRKDIHATFVVLR